MVFGFGILIVTLVQKLSRVTKDDEIQEIHKDAKRIVKGTE